MSFSQSGVGDRGQRGGPFGYALLSPPLVGRSGRVRCSVLLQRGRAWRFRRVPAFSAWPGNRATSSKTLPLGLSAWTVVFLSFPDVFAGFRFPALAVGVGGLVFLDLGASAWAFLRGLRTTITKVDSKMRSLESALEHTQYR